MNKFFQIMALLVVMIANFVSPAIADEVEPLTDEVKAMLDGLAEDAEPEKLNATRADLEGRHYLSGDERHMELFYPDLKDLGGVYFGVGTDQAYLFAGWMRPDLVFLTDYDPWIKRMHIAYALFFGKAETIEQFVAYWDPKNVKSTRAFLKESLPAEQYRAVVEVYNAGCSQVHRRMKRLQKWMTAAKVPSFVTDPAMYSYVRELVMKNRVKPMLGNLLGDKGLAGIAEICKKLNIPVRAIYPSNDEQYWNYNDRFRNNMRAQLFDDRSIIVRTVATHPKNGDYHYNVQGAKAFLADLDNPKKKNVRTVVNMNQPNDIIPYTHLDNPQPKTEEKAPEPAVAP